MKVRIGRRQKTVTPYQIALTARFEQLQELLRDFPGIREKSLRRGLTYRYNDRIVFVLTRKPRIILLEMKLPEFVADEVLRLPHVRPHKSTRLARTGWIAVAVRVGTPLDRICELVSRCYDFRIESNAPR
jgi:hypothetical protein